MSEVHRQRNQTCKLGCARPIKEPLPKHSANYFHKMILLQKGKQIQALGTFC